jgi:DNA polymerase III subunit delta
VKIPSTQLSAHLARALAPVYLVSGDEPLLATEVADAIRARARAAGHDERVVHAAERGFDWTLLHDAGASLSLFAQRRLIEVRLASASPGAEGAAALQRYAGDPPPDVVLLVTCPRIDRKAAGAKWIAALESAGVHVEVRPLSTSALPGWIDERMRARGLAPTAGAARLLAERVEGNLLAAAQEIEKLSLLHGEGEIDEAQVRLAVADSARYDVYQLADAALAGDTARALRVLDGLRAEGVEPPLVLWAVTRDVRGLAALAWEKASRGRSAVTNDIWWSRRKQIEAAQPRVPLWRAHALLLRAGAVDGIVKGRAENRPRPWDALAGLVTDLANACAR